MKVDNPYCKNADGKSVYQSGNDSNNPNGFKQYFNYIGSITLPLDVVRNCSHSGPCDEDVKRALELPEVKAELAGIDPEDLKKELAEYGAWDDNQLSNHADNLERILWIAAGNIQEDSPR
jgi:hypothetical protein